MTGPRSSALDAERSEFDKGVDDLKTRLKEGRKATLANFARFAADDMRFNLIAIGLLGLCLYWS